MTCKEGFQRGAQQPDLNNEENENQCHRAVDCHKSASLLGRFNISFLLRPALSGARFS